MIRRDEVVAVAEDLVGSFAVVADLSWDIGLAVVLDVVLAGGERAVVKGHLHQRHHDREVAAYERWVPAIADRAPRLLASEASARVVVLSRLDGDSAPDDDPAVYRDAGAVLRRFHAAEPATDGSGWCEQRFARFDQWVARAAPGLLDDGDVAWARARAGRLLELPAPPLVPCHGDWQPRNWCLHDGRVLAFDFERAERGWWIDDVGRMWIRRWAGRPDLRDAFFEGYGRAPDEAELAGLDAEAALGHISTIVWATEVGDAAFAEEGRAALRHHRQQG